jgi:hypothetical protein
MGVRNEDPRRCRLPIGKRQRQPVRNVGLYRRDEYIFVATVEKADVDRLVTAHLCGP